MPDALQQRCQHIVTSPVLTPEQKRHFLALEAENNLPYPALPEAARARAGRGIHLRHVRRPCALQNPRYVLPDYAKFLANGSENGWSWKGRKIWMMPSRCSLSFITTFRPSHRCRSIWASSMRYSALMLRILTQDEIDSRIKRFWRYLDRTLPDAFMHANIGPADTPVTRAILRADAELKQVAPNLTFIYDPDVTPAICC